LSLFRPVAVDAPGTVAAGAMVCRYRSGLYLTAIVKATFAIAPTGAISLAPPEELGAGDRVPFRPRADVTLGGFAGGSSRTVARLAIRGERLLLDKTIHDPIGCGPLAPTSPIRASLFGSGDLGVLDAPVPEIPSDVDWAFFQAAPLDQRIDFLRGNEEILLEGLHPAAPRIFARLPNVRATGTAYGPDPRSIDLQADGLHIDAERLVCTVTWRALMRVADARDLAQIHLVLGITVGAPSSRPAASDFTGTMRLSAKDLQAARVPPPPPPGAAAVAKTVRLSADELRGTLQITAAALAPSVSSPFPIASPGEPRAAAAPIDGAPWASSPAVPAPRPASSFAATLDLGPELRAHAEALVPAPDAPPELPAPEAPAPAPVADAPSPPPPPPPAPRPRPAPAPDANDALYRRFAPRKKT
jgi:Uncharacterized protein conserved in bacteria (DUF2169)